MKNLILISLLLSVSILVNGQSQDGIGLYQSIWGMEKKAIVESYMDKLTTDESAIFWTEYEAYEEGRKELGKDRVMILGDYADNYGNLTGDKATDLINRAYKNNVAIQKLLNKTFKKMSKSIDPVKVAKFIQMENYFMIMIQMYIQETIPFVDELK